MSTHDQLIKKIYAINKWVSSEVSISLKKERVYSGQNFIKYNPNLQLFFWLRSNRDYNIHGVSNLKYTMGYEKVNTQQSFDMIHPDHQNVFLLLSWAFSKFWASGEIGEKLLNFNFVIHLPMRDINNKYWLVRQNNCICELNIKNQALSFLSWHNILSPYQGEPINFRGYSDKGARVFEIEEQIKRQANYYKALPFTMRQQEILKMYIQLDNPEAIDIANIAGLAKETIYTHNRDMLQRARIKYQRDFRDIYQLSDFFERYEVFGKTVKNFYE